MNVIEILKQKKKNSKNNNVSVTLCNPRSLKERMEMLSQH